MRRCLILSLYLCLCYSLLRYDIVQIRASVLHSKDILLLPADQPSLCQNPKTKLRTFIAKASYLMLISYYTLPNLLAKELTPF